MGTFTTALGDTYTVERRLPSLGWRPRWRGMGDPTDAAFVDIDDPSGILVAIAVIIAIVILAVVVVPVLLFVAELALLIAIVIPLMVLAVGIGLVRHTVQVRAGGKDGTIIDRREVRGLISSWRAARELRADAASGRYRQLASAVGGGLPTSSTPPGVSG